MADQRHLLRRLPALLCAIVAVGVLVGCSGGGGASEPDLKTASLTEYAGVLSMADQVSLDRRRVHITEDAVAACMQAAGFSYEPYYDAYKGNGASLGLSTDFTSLDYAKAHGFGVVDLTIIPAAGPAISNPNDVALQSKPFAEQRAYLAALDGPTVDGSVSCRDQADAAFGKDVGIDYAALQNVLADVQASPELSAAREEWSKCAVAAGFAAASRLELINQIVARVHAVTGDGPSNNVSAQDLETIRADEVAAAVATFPCSQEFDPQFLRVFLSRAASTGNPD